jgi:hypothetical protein
VIRDASVDDCGNVQLELNGRVLDASSVSRMGQALDEADAHAIFELVASVPDGPSMFMLRSGADAWLMYLREPGDAGFHSSGEADRAGVASYTLSNGQEDEYPLAWCIDVEQCYRAIAYFCVNEGAKPGWVDWIED